VNPNRRPFDRLEHLERAAADLALARKVLHCRVLEARSPDLFDGTLPLRAVAAAAGVSVETVRKLERTPVGEW
jgi:hypothetical protein